MIIHTIDERAHLIEAGKRLGILLSELETMVAPGVWSNELDAYAEKRIREWGDVPAFLDYTPDSASRPYPATLCVSINEEIVHGIPNEQPRILKEGDIVSLDLGLIHEGMIVDSAITVPVGNIDTETQRLLTVVQQALYSGIKAANVGGRIGDISSAIEGEIKGTGFSVVRELGGHGVGREVHEEPFIANYGHVGTGPEIEEGMVLALEPIANKGKAGAVIAPDGYTYRTKDGSVSAHFEHTILVESSGTTIVTKRPTEVVRM